VSAPKRAPGRWLVDRGNGPRPPWGGVEPWDSRLMRRLSLAFTLGMLGLGLALNLACCLIERVCRRGKRRRRGNR
jgi:hypothetical protein